MLFFHQYLFLLSSLVAVTLIDLSATLSAQRPAVMVYWSRSSTPEKIFTLKCIWTRVFMWVCATWRGSLKVCVCGGSECTCDWVLESISLWPAVMMHNSQPFGTWSGDPAVHSPACLTLWALFHTAQPSANCHSNEGWSPSYGWWIAKKEGTCQAGGGEERGARAGGHQTQMMIGPALAWQVKCECVGWSWASSAAPAERKGHLAKCQRRKNGWSPDISRMGKKRKKRNMKREIIWTIEMNNMV